LNVRSFFILGRKPRVQKANGTTASLTSPSKKLPTSNLLVNALFADAHDNAFSSPKRKESKIDGVLMENSVGKHQHMMPNGKVKTYRPATRSTRKINEYFAKLPANGIIRVQNGHNSHSDDSCDSIDDHNSSHHHDEIKIVTAENVPPNNHASDDHILQSKLPKISNGPLLKPEAQIANTNLFLQEPVLKLDFDKNECASSQVVGTSPNAGATTIKTSFLSTEVTTKFQTLPPTEYINKVLNVNGSHDDDQTITHIKVQNGFLLNSDSNSSDSGVVINGCSSNNDSDNMHEHLLKSPMPVAHRRSKPTTPHRMILCSSPVKISNDHDHDHVTLNNKQSVEIVKPARSKNHKARAKYETYLFIKLFVY
jgi:hypothetical protein